MTVLAMILMIYGFGMLIGLMLHMRYTYEDQDITLGDLTASLLWSTMSWILVVAITSFMLEDAGFWHKVIFKAKRNKDVGNKQSEKKAKRRQRVQEVQGSTTV